MSTGTGRYWASTATALCHQHDVPLGHLVISGDLVHTVLFEEHVQRLGDECRAGSGPLAGVLLGGEQVERSEASGVTRKCLSISLGRSGSAASASSCPGRRTCSFALNVERLGRRFDKALHPLELCSYPPP